MRSPFQSVASALIAAATAESIGARLSTQQVRAQASRKSSSASYSCACTCSDHWLCFSVVGRSWLVSVCFQTHTVPTAFIGRPVNWVPSDLTKYQWGCDAPTPLSVSSLSVAASASPTRGADLLTGVP